MAVKKKANIIKSKQELALREAPEERNIQKQDVLLPMLSKAAMNLVLNKTPEWAIKVRQGRGGNYRYVKHGYVTDQLNKIFGFDWDIVTTLMQNGQMYALEVEEIKTFDKQGKPTGTMQQRHIAVSGYIEARVHNASGKVTGTIKKSGFGSQIWLPGQELGDAIKGAESDLIKVCAQRIGIALDLYWDEDSEQQSFAEKQKASAQEAQIMSVLSQVPTTAVILISRSMTEYNAGVSDIEEVAKVTIGEIMTWDAGQIGELWKSIKAAYEVIDGEVKEG